MSSYSILAKSGFGNEKIQWGCVGVLLPLRALAWAYPRAYPCAHEHARMHTRAHPPHCTRTYGVFLRSLRTRGVLYANVFCSLAFQWFEIDFNLKVWCTISTFIFSHLTTWTLKLSPLLCRPPDLNGFTKLIHGEKARKVRNCLHPLWGWKRGYCKNNNEINRRYRVPSIKYQPDDWGLEGCKNGQALYWPMNIQWFTIDRKKTWKAI